MSPVTVHFFAHGGSGTVQFRVDIPNRPALAGLAFGTRALLLDPSATNAPVSCSPEDAKLPLVFASEREAIAALLTTIRPYSDDDLRLVRIRDTMRLDRLIVSRGCLGALSAPWRLDVDPDERLIEKLDENLRGKRR